MNLILGTKDESEVAESAPLPVVELGVNKEVIMQAAQELGLSSFTPNKLMAIHTAGSAMKKVGVLKIGRTFLYRSMEGAEAGLAACQEALRTIEDPESRAAILPTQKEFVKELREASTAFIKSAELDGNDDSDRRSPIKPFAPGAMAGPVLAVQQAVVTINQTEKK